MHSIFLINANLRSIVTLCYMGQIRITITDDLDQGKVIMLKT